MKNFKCVTLITACFVIGFVKSQWAYEDDSKDCNGNDECVPIKQCKPLLDLLSKFSQIPVHVRQQIKELQCQKSGRHVKVCCSLSTDQNNNNPSPPDVSTHRNYNLLPKDCGYMDNSDRIYMGNKTELYEFPWMALISHSGPTGPNFGCGGTIINEKYILTAAHCVSDLVLKQRNKIVLGVRVGEHNIDTPIDCQTNKGTTICSPPHQDFGIERLIPHQQFDTKEWKNDIALIRLRGKINFKENMRPVCLPIEDGRTYQFGANKGVVAGWGNTEERHTSKVLLKANIPVYTLQQCQERYKRNNVATPITHLQLCAGGQGPDSCNGDSGGPLQAVLAHDSDVRYMQQGVVSFGPTNCGLTELPGVYTRVAYFMDWILDNMTQ